MKRQNDNVVFTYGVPLEGFPLRSVIREGKAAETLAHRHSCGQLLYPEHGATLLEIGDRVVRLGPGQAAWIPPDVPHAVLMERPYRYHSLYIDPAFHANDQFSVILISPLLRELIIDARSWPKGDIALAQRQRKAQVIVDELERAPTLNPGIHIPDDARLALVCRALEKDPSNRKSMKDWAKEIGASEKTVQRLFIEKTGLSFQQWRNFVKMTAALELHRQGLRLLDIAIALGYSTEGAYAQAFKKFYGYPPSQQRRISGPSAIT